MKAMIVIDIEDKAFEYYSKQNPKALTVDMIDHVGERGGFYSPKFLSLKPMPQKRELEESGNSLIDDCKEYYTDGWNDCLSIILGEEE